MSPAMQRAGVLLVGSAAAAVVLLGACGGDGDDDAGPASGDVTVVAKDTLSFDKGDYAAQAGEVSITYEAGGSMAHTLLIEGVDDFKLQVSSTGDSDTGTVDLEAGEYQIYCDIPGHESMRATLTVE
jgi:plastocyanin